MKRDGFYIEEGWDRRVDLLSLEEHIMTAWQTESDLLLLEDNIETLSEDDLMNAVLGIRVLNTMRMNKLWNVFDEACHNRRKLIEAGEIDGIHSSSVPKHNL